MSNFLGDIVETFQTCYFGNFGYVWPPPSIYDFDGYQFVASFHGYLHAEKPTSSFTSFLRCYREITNLVNMGMPGHTHLKC